MKYNCPFCQLPMINKVPIKEEYSCHTCSKCPVTQEFFCGAAIISINCRINNGNGSYTVTLNYWSKETIFIHWFTSEDGITIGDICLKIPKVLNITPDNIVEKVKLYMVFS